MGFVGDERFVQTPQKKDRNFAPCIEGIENVHLEEVDGHFINQQQKPRAHKHNINSKYI